MENEVLNLIDKYGVKALVSKIKKLFAKKADVEALKENTDLYITEIDYSQLAFDTSEVISETMVTYEENEFGGITYDIISSEVSNVEDDVSGGITYVIN
jgi:hypothetical protein